MISSLSIENFALIDKMSVNFFDGFSTMTGETGAGKSILLGALGLILGKRADLSVLKNKEQKCIIEAGFNLKGYNLQHFFSENDLDYDENTIIRREILPSGKSRAFINDGLVNLNELQQLGGFLVDIHSQNETRELSEEDFQFRIIDAIADNNLKLQLFSKQLKIYKAAKKKQQELKDSLAIALKEQDYNTFLFDELYAAQLKSGEQETLESDFEKLSNVEFISEVLNKAAGLSGDEQVGILTNLKDVRASFQKISGFSVDYKQLFDRIDSSLIELDDIFSEVEQLQEGLSADPQELETINQKLQLIYNLQKKHQVSTVEELLSIQEELDQKVVSVSDLESTIAKQETEISAIEVLLDSVAAEIHDARLDALPKLTAKLTSILELLGMPHVRFNIELLPLEKYMPNGKEELKFLFSANKGTDFGLLSKVASGGELSRIMLAVKAILAQYSNLPTIIFDEIDTGVSGEIANKMGLIMQEMSSHMQVLSITHLPQIAAKGKHHYKVYKETENDITSSNLIVLSKEERVTEIAQMLSGADISDSALKHAKELLN
ncbi:MAG: DNA repair protein RecN [Flavobacterium sp.]